MSEEPELNPAQTEELLLNTTNQLYRAMGDALELAARVDGLEILLASLGSHVGISPDELASKLRIAQATSHQKRLEMLEEKNPSIAALLDTRSGMPPIDETMLKKMDIGDGPNPENGKGND